MDEITLVERAFAEAPASEDVKARGRDRLTELARGGAAAVPARRRMAPPVRWSLGLAAATVAAGVVAAAIVVPGADEPARPQESPARRILLVAAARSAATPPGQGRYFRQTIESGRVIEVLAKDKGHYNVEVREVDGWWYPRTPGAPGWRVTERLAPRGVTPADEKAWRTDGSPVMLKEKCWATKQDIEDNPDNPPNCEPENATPHKPWVERVDGDGAGDMSSRPGVDVPRLSDDPATLRRQLEKWAADGGTAGPVGTHANELWGGVLYLLFDGRSTPAQRAAAYRILADLPEVRSLGPVTDPAGRTGQGLAIGTQGGGTARLVIDPGTGLPLSSEGYTGNVRDDYEMLVVSGPTDTEPPHE